MGHQSCCLRPWGRQRYSRLHHNWSGGYFARLCRLPNYHHIRGWWICRANAVFFESLRQNTMFRAERRWRLVFGVDDLPMACCIRELLHMLLYTQRILPLSVLAQERTKHVAFATTHDLQNNGGKPSQCRL